MTKVTYLPSIECLFQDLSPGDFFTTRHNSLCIKTIPNRTDADSNAVNIRTGEQKYFELSCNVTKHQSVRIEVC